VALGRFVDAVRSFEPDLVHLQYAGGRPAALALLAGLSPLVVNVVGSDVCFENHPGGVPWLSRRLTHRVLAAADLVLVKSVALRQRLSGFAGVAGRVETVPWGVDPERFKRDAEGGEALRHRLGIAPRARVVLSTRSPRPLYNLDLLVAALPAIRASEPDACLVMTESGSDPACKARLERQVADRGLEDHVRFVGHIDHEEMPALYSLADVVVSVPGNDALPQSLLEAMACETPCVLSRLPGYLEVVAEGESAVLVDLTPESVAGGVLRVLSEPALARSLAEGSRRRSLEVAALPREVERVVGWMRELPPRRVRRGYGFANVLDAAGLLSGQPRAASEIRVA
jgi:glycosyltransferase involved in cell wall biosynthesis